MKIDRRQLKERNRKALYFLIANVSNMAADTSSYWSQLAAKPEKVST